MANTTAKSALIDAAAWGLLAAGAATLFGGLVVSDPSIAPALLFLIVFFGAATIGGVLRFRWRAARRARAGHCPACGYDLRETAARGCPECGRGRGGGPDA